MPYSTVPRSTRFCTSTTGSRSERFSTSGSGFTSTTGSVCTTAAGCERRCLSSADTKSLSSISSGGSEGEDPSKKLLAMDLYILANCSQEKDFVEEYVMDAVKHMQGLCSIKVVESHHFAKKRVL